MEEEKRMYHYTYQIDNLINGKYYRGKHSAKSLDNDYMGSGKLIIKAIDKWGIENFKKTILKTFPTSAEAFAHEAEIVTQKEVDDPMCYNLTLGGCGGNTFANKTEEEMDIIGNKISTALQKFSAEELKERNYECTRKWQESHPEAANEHHRKAIDKWAKNNIERVREIHRESARRCRAKKKKAQ